MSGGGALPQSTHSTRGVAEEPRHAVEDVAAFEEAAEDLIVQAMDPFPANLEGVAAGDDGDVVADLAPPEDFVNRRVQEKRMPKAVGSTKPRAARTCADSGSSIGGHRSVHRRARAPFAVISKVALVQDVRFDRAHQVDVEHLDSRRAFSAVGGVAVGIHVERLVDFDGSVEVVRDVQVVAGRDRPVEAAEKRAVMQRPTDRVVLHRPSRRRVVENEVDLGQALAINVGLN